MLSKNAKTNTFHKTIAQRLLDKLGMTHADNIRPYAKSIKHKPFRENGLRSLGMTEYHSVYLLRDVEDAVPYALVHTIICSSYSDFSI